MTITLNCANMALLSVCTLSSIYSLKEDHNILYSVEAKHLSIIDPLLRKFYKVFTMSIQGIILTSRRVIFSQMSQAARVYKLYSILYRNNLEY